MNILAIDLGLKRIGVALSINGICMPQDAILRKNREQASSEVRMLLKKHKIDLLLIGIPMGGAAEDEMRRRATHFASLLEFENVKFVDESFTSKRAEKYINSRKKDGKQDSMAAFLMLSDYVL